MNAVTAAFRTTSREGNVHGAGPWSRSRHDE
jgi:hypothetical protein